jgi:hypothetical protein
MNTNVLLGYLLALTIAGFFLWVLRGFIRGLQQKNELPISDFAVSEESGDDATTVNWPIHVFTDRQDDLPVPGRLMHLNPAGAYLQSSACLVTGQKISLYIDVPGQDQVRVTAFVLWAADCQGNRNGAQVRFEGMAPDLRASLYRMAGEAPLLFVRE